MKSDKLLQKLEAILFIAGEPMSFEKLARVLKEEKEEIKKSLDDLEGVLSGRGIRLSVKDGEYLLVTAPDVSKTVEDFLKEEIGEELSRAMLETLAVIVYKGPLSRSEIDYIRGVNSSFTLRNLLVRGLAERVPNPKDARIWLYRPSFEFLKFVGIEKLERLPQYEEFKKEMEELLKNQS